MKSGSKGGARPDPLSSAKLQSAGASQTGGASKAAAPTDAAPDPDVAAANEAAPESEDADVSGARARRDTPRRATAEAMAAKQRDISVSEFFTKNKHLLGFDNPRKALLTTVKEAVDNSLDACEEAGILPEIWVHIERTGDDRYKVGIQDNGPGIVKKQIPLIFGKLLYGSKFHRLRMSRGQQGIGISAAGMNGFLTTGKPVKIVSKVSPKKPAHYFEVQIATKSNHPEILNGKGEGVDIPPGAKGLEYIRDHGIEWVNCYDAPQGETPQEVASGTRVTIELEGKHVRGRGSVDEYLEQTAIANPHVTLHYLDPDGTAKTYARAASRLPPEPKEIKPHPYGVELGRLATMLKDSKGGTLSQFLTDSFSRVSSGIARKICETAKLSTRANPKNAGRHEAENLYKAILETKIPPPSTDCLAPIGEELLLKGLYKVVPGEFYAAATRPPAVYRGNPFQIEVALAFGGATAIKVSRDALEQMLSESDARTMRQFITTSFDGLGSEAAERIVKEAKLGARQSPGRLSKEETGRLHDAMRNVNLSDGQTMQVLRYANRVPLQFQPAACAITQAVMNTNWRAYGLQQSRNSLPSGPTTVMVHIASVWVPFTSESKEAVASYPEVQKELRLGLQAVGRKLGTYLNRRKKVKQEGERRSVFMRYLGEVADAVSSIRTVDRDELYESLLRVAQKKTAEADAKFDDRGRRIVDESPEEDFGEHVIIVPQEEE